MVGFGILEDAMKSSFTTLSGKPVTEFAEVKSLVVETAAGTVNIDLANAPKEGFKIVNRAEGAEINGVLFGLGNYEIDDDGEVVPAISPN